MDTSENKNKVLGSKYFCMMPWIHVHLWPDSTAHLCCISESKMPIGKYTGDLFAILNSKPMKETRLKMLSGQPVEACTRCYQLENNNIQSLRQSSVSNYSKYFDAVEKTASDGSIKDFTMRYLDIRFSNKCNLRCRSCGPDLSSSWAADHISMYGYWVEKKNLIEIDKIEKLWTELLPSLDNVEEVYFAGGEPLITDQVYDIMDYWIEKNNTRVQIGFTTNFTNLNYKGKNALEYFKKFPNLTVFASLDDSGIRAEYLRKGTRWSTIVENRKKMLEVCPEVSFELTPTISVFNVIHFPDFHYEWLSAGLVKHTDLRLNILTKPSHMAINIIPIEKRASIIAKWTAALNRIIQTYGLNPDNYNKTISGYQSVIHALKHEPYTKELKDFFKRNDLLDAVREEHLYDVYPELEDILKE